MDRILDEVAERLVTDQFRTTLPNRRDLTSAV